MQGYSYVELEITCFKMLSFFSLSLSRKYFSLEKTVLFFTAQFSSDDECWNHKEVDVISRKPSFRPIKILFNTTKLSKFNHSKILMFPKKDKITHHSST